MAADYMDHPFCIMAKIEIDSINTKIVKINYEIEVKEDELSFLKSKEAKLKQIMGQAKEILEKCSKADLRILGKEEIAIFQEIKKEAKLKVEKRDHIRKGIKNLEKDIRVLQDERTFLLDEIDDLNQRSKNISSNVITGRKESTSQRIVNTPVGDPNVSVNDDDAADIVVDQSDTLSNSNNIADKGNDVNAGKDSNLELNVSNDEGYNPTEVSEGVDLIPLKVDDDSESNNFVCINTNYDKSEFINSMASVRDLKDRVTFSMTSSNNVANSNAPRKIISLEVPKEDGSKVWTSTEVPKAHLGKNKAENAPSIYQDNNNMALNINKDGTDNRSRDQLAEHKTPSKADNDNGSASASDANIINNTAQDDNNNDGVDRSNNQLTANNPSIVNAVDAKSNNIINNSNDIKCDSSNTNRRIQASRTAASSRNEVNFQYESNDVDASSDSNKVTKAPQGDPKDKEKKRKYVSTIQIFMLIMLLINEISLKENEFRIRIENYRKHMMNKDSKCVYGTNDNTFVAAMIFAQSEVADNKRDFKKESNHNDKVRDESISNESWLKLMDFDNEEINCNHEMNNYNVSNIKVHEGASLALKEMKINNINIHEEANGFNRTKVHEGEVYQEESLCPSNKSCIERITISKSHQVKHKYQYDMPFKEKYKQGIERNRKDYLLLFIFLLLLLSDAVVLLKIKMMDFMTSSQDDEEIILCSKKDCNDTACDVILCVGLVKYTSTDHNDMRSQIIEARSYSKMKPIRYDTKKFIKYTREQTITTNEGVLEYGNLPPKCLFVLNCLKNIF